MIRIAKSKAAGRCLAGAVGLALTANGLAGCADGPEQANAQLKAEKGLGQWWVYGDLPGKAPNADDQPNPRSIPFNPEHFAVVYLRFNNGGHLTARHAYFPIVGQDDDVACAITYLKGFDTASGPEPGSGCIPVKDRVRATRPSDKPIEHRESLKPMSENFEDFDFGSEQRLYVFVDNANVKFSHVAPVSFSPFGAFDKPVVPGKETRDPNHSFYNARFQDFGEYEHVLLVDNYYRGVEGKDIGAVAPWKDSADYSINFNLLTCRRAGSTCDFTDEKQVIPLAIDPDTGNGWGSKP